MLVEVSGLRVTYGPTVAVDDVSFHADAGVIALLGPNGAGKTSLLSVLAGAKRLTRGRVVVAEKATTSLEAPKSSAARARAKVGYLPQSFDLVSGMTLLDTVRYAAWCNLVPRAELTDVARQSLTSVDLQSQAHARVRTLSGGQRQRLGLAAATAHDPSLLLLDEPTAGLDPEQRIRFRSYVRSIAPTTCIIIATHLLDDCQYAADRVVVLGAGRLRFDGTVEALANEGSDSEPKSRESELERGYRAALDSHEPRPR